MKNRFIVIYTIFASAVFIFSMGFFGYNLYNEYSTNLEKSEEKNTILVNNIRTLSMDYLENTTTYSQAIQKAMGDAGNYSYIHIRRNNETVVLYPSGKSKEETLSKLTKNFTSNITVNKLPIYIDINYYLIRPDSIFYFARISFLMILIITIITIIMIIYLNLSEANSDVISLKEETEETAAADTDDESDDFETEEIDETEEADEAVDVEETAVTEKVTEADEASEADESQPSENETESEDNYETKASAEVTPEEVKAILSEPLNDEAAKLPINEEIPTPLPEAQTSANSNEPAGLFNPETGIGWESYLMTRLNNEIERATASEIDLSLFVIKLPSIEKSSDIFKNVCNYLAIQFQFKDLLFEYKEDCIVAIKISMNVDEALSLADKLYSDICNIVDNKASRIGISSRSIRMLTGDRLLLEAEQAIEHSDEASPVIAFRVDSEKYRKLMEQNQGN